MQCGNFATKIWEIATKFSYLIAKCNNFEPCTFVLQEEHRVMSKSLGQTNTTEKLRFFLAYSKQENRQD